MHDHVESSGRAAFDTGELTLQIRILMKNSTPTTAAIEHTQKTYFWQFDKSKQIAQ
jgi:hypothetical protein